MLAAAVDASEGFFVEQAHELVPVGDFLHDVHEHLVMVGGDVGFLENRRELVLVRGHLVVARGHGNADFIGLLGHFVHVIENAFLDGSEILVFELLALGRRRAEQGAAGELQIGAQPVVALVDEEIFLLGPAG